MRSSRCGAPASGVWSTALYFQICRGRTGDELRIYAGDAIYRWQMPWGIPSSVGERRVAVERSAVTPGNRVSETGAWDEGFCYVEPYERGALGHFLLGHVAGELTLSLAGVRVWGTFYLLRPGATVGADAEWQVCRLVAAERVA